jgi:hypothetical protein
MVLDPTASSVQTNIRTERPTTYATEKQPDRAKAERPETGQTSEANSAVVTNISAAALEASRAATPAEQGAEQDRAADAVRNAERGQDQAAAADRQRRAEDQEEAAERQRQRVDVMA